jgi:hypothetical protein
MIDNSNDVLVQQISAGYASHKYFKEVSSAGTG